MVRKQPQKYFENICLALLTYRQICRYYIHANDAQSVARPDGFRILKRVTKMAKTTDYTVIEIQIDGVWAGSGKLRGDSENGWQIVDCGAQFCDDNDESEEVYGCIEDAIECGDDAVDFRGQRITWTITVPVTEHAIAAINKDWYANCQSNAGDETIKSWFVQVFNQDVEIDDELSIWLPLANDWATQEQIDTAVATIEAGV